MKRTKYDLSHYKLLTAYMGRLIPIGLQEVIPGDTFQSSTSLLVRMSPMVAPVMHPIDIRIHSFYVPNRLIDERLNHNWEDFITGGKDNAYNAPVPTMNTSNFSGPGPSIQEKMEVFSGSLGDYYGLGYAGEDYDFNAYPIYGYNEIYKEFYADQDLFTVPEPEGTVGPYFIAWEKDYFTTARPWPYKGPTISVPVSDTVSGVLDPSHGGTESGSFTLEDLRTAAAMQRFAEARAKYGSRYTEYLRYLGIKPSDSRLDRPEFLGGGKSRVNISEVLQTAPETSDPVPGGTEYGVGDMYGHGIGAVRTRPWRRYFEEHGYVHTLMSIRPAALYQQGLDRHWLKQDREEYFTKEFAFLGDQEVLTGEVYASDNTSNHETFGYNDRYAEYRHQASRVSGEFKDVLNYWHLARDFESKPALNQDFLVCNPSERIFAVQQQHHCWVMAQHKIAARRQVPRVSMARTI